MIKEIPIETFMQKSKAFTLLDVRSLAEFEKGHMPGAENLPLLSNEGRAKVGTIYKEKGREAAVLLGFDLTADKWRGFIEKALEIAPKRKVALHCSRGGMRSSIMAWALDLYGFDVSVIEGGYKSYRNWVLQQFEKDYSFLVLGGMTGSHKTKILLEMAKSGEQIIDLEGLANHQGSAFGSMNKMTQSTQQQFENDMAAGLISTSNQRPIWIEDESRTIGKRIIPEPIWKQMRTAPLIELKVKMQQRIDFLVQEYGVLDKQFLTESTHRIRKRLGPEQTQNAITAIEEGRMADFIETVLAYYDKAYEYGISQRDETSVFPIEVEVDDLSQNAAQIVEFAQQI